MTCTDKNLDERRNIVDRKLALLSQGHIPESQLAKHVQFVLHCISLEDKRKQGQPFEKSHFELIFKSYSGGDLEPEESFGKYSDSLMKLSSFLFLCCSAFMVF